MSNYNPTENWGCIFDICQNISLYYALGLMTIAVSSNQACSQRCYDNKTRRRHKHPAGPYQIYKTSIFLTHTPNLCISVMSLHWRHNGHDSVSNHQPHDCLLNRLVKRRSKKIPKLRVTGLCAGNSPETGEFPAQMASNAEDVSIWCAGVSIQGTQA